MANSTIFLKYSAMLLSREPAKALVRWEIADLRNDLTDYEFLIERSNAANAIDSFQNKTIDGAPLPTPETKSRNLLPISQWISALDYYQFLDFTIPTRDLNGTYWYRITSRRKSTNELVSTPMFSMDGQLDVVGLYIVDEVNWLLDDQTGSPSFVYSRRRGGIQCDECYDKIQKKTTKSRCHTCFGTSWKEGYFKPFDCYIDFNPNPKDVRIQEWGETQENETNILLSNYPILTPGDLIRELQSQRLWRVTKQQQTEKRRIPMLQIARVTEVKPADIEYSIQYDEKTAQEILKRFEDNRMRREF